MDKESIILNLRAVIGRAYPRIIGAQREVSWLFFDTVVPIIMLATYVLIYKLTNAPSEFVGFVILGGVMMPYWLNVLWSMAAQLYWEKDIGNLQLYMIAPMSNTALLAGMALGGMFSTTVRAVLVLLAGIFIFRVSFMIVNATYLFLTFFLTLFALYGLGMMFASLYLMWGREAWQVSSLMEEPIFLVSGFYFPVKMLGFWVSTVASLIPITIGLDAMRQLLFPSSWKWALMPITWEILILSIMSIVFPIIAKKLLDFMEMWSRREGRLTLRWQ
ncbi:MAG: ABC transporter permease [Candidatus Njordarchaeia archaeon]